MERHFADHERDDLVSRTANVANSTTLERVRLRRRKARCDRRAGTGINSHTNADSNADSNAHADPNGYSHAFTDCYSYADSYPNAYTDTDSHSTFLRPRSSMTTT
jgi:hypothetical protein